MGQPDPPTRGGAHRAPATPVSVARNLAGPLIAVGAVVAVIALLVFLNGQPAPKGTPTVQRQLTTVRTTVPTPASPTRARTPPPSPNGERTTSASTSASTPVGVAEAPVTVLNNSTYTGLASKVAAQIRAKGWPVADVGNFGGRVSETTIYFAPGQEQVARLFAARFPKVQRVLPRFAALPGSGLTLVVTRHWVD